MEQFVRKGVNGSDLILLFFYAQNLLFFMPQELAVRFNMTSFGFKRADDYLRVMLGYVISLIMNSIVMNRVGYPLVFGYELEEVKIEEVEGKEIEDIQPATVRGLLEMLDQSVREGSRLGIQLYFTKLV